MAHYTRTRRLLDHRTVIEHLKANPPAGWNGKIILFGVSEGGPLVTTLTTDFQENVVATINWSGSGDWGWRDELWLFVEKLLFDNPDCPEHKLKLKDCPCIEDVATRGRFDLKMSENLKNPTTAKEFLGMTYLYHADAMTFPNPEYEKMHHPFLVVTGALDTIAKSSDDFVSKAKKEGLPITYHRIDDMDHYVRKRPDVIEKTFAWIRSLPL